MKCLFPSHLSKAVLFYFIITEVASIAVLWAPVQASEEDAQRNLSATIVRVAKQNIPAVVNIEATQGQKPDNPLLPFKNDPFFQYFFSGARIPPGFRRELQGIGTGMIMDSQSNILTNNHVVRGATLKPSPGSRRRQHGYGF